MFGIRLLLGTMCVGLIQHKETKRDPSAGSDEQCLHTHRPCQGRSRGRAHHTQPHCFWVLAPVLVLVLVLVFNPVAWLTGWLTERDNTFEVFIFVKLATFN